MKSTIQSTAMPTRGYAVSPAALCPSNRLSSANQLSWTHRVRRLRPFSSVKRLHIVTATAAEGPAATSPGNTTAAAELLKTAAEGRTLVPKAEIFKAMKDLDKQRLKGGDEWYRTLGGTSSPGRRWRLVYTVDKEEMEKDRKGVAEAQGKFFPLTAAQRFDAETQEIENGVFLGHVASLTFLGPHAWLQQKKLVFNFWKLNIKLGPWKFTFDIKKGDKDAPFDAADKGLPFFVFIYIDEDIAVAKGRGGGWAYWARTDPKWDLEHGIL